jgi:hypothetical protein
MQKVVPACVQLASGGHAGHAAAVTVVEAYRSLAQMAEIRGFDPVTAVWFEGAPIQGVEHDHDRFHIILPH